MTKIFFLTIALALFSTAVLADDMSSWKTFTKNVKGSVWGISVKYPAEWKVVEGQKENGRTRTFFTKNERCLDMELVAADCAKDVWSLVVVSIVDIDMKKTNDGKKIPFAGAKDNVAYQDDQKISFISPDGRFKVVFAGKGDLFEKALKTLKLVK